MPVARLSRVVRQVRCRVAEPDRAVTDGALLDRFVHARDEAAFAELVRRHGPTVLGVCRRALGNHPDAEDAFQATFLVLLKRASAVRSREVVGCWLYGVGYRTALEARRSAARRQAREVQALLARTTPADACADLREVLDREIAALPEGYRAALILTDLEGKCRREAARQLGVAEGTVASRVARARGLLADRLRRAGVVVPVAALPLVLAREAGATPLAEGTVLSAAKALMGPAATVSPRVLVLTKGVLNAMLLSKLKFAGFVSLTLGFVAAATLLIVPEGAGPPAFAQPAGKATRVESLAKGYAGLSDAEFIRKACLDLRGSLPSDIEVQYFLKDPSPGKRAWLLDRLNEEAARASARRAPAPGADDITVAQCRSDDMVRTNADLLALQGTWEAVTYQHQGKVLPRERFAHVRLEFQGDRVTFHSKAGAQRVHKVRVWADPLPKVMRFEPADERELAPPQQYVYELKGDRLRLGVTNRTDLPIPAEGDSRPAAEMYVIELRRVKDGGKVAPTTGDPDDPLGPLMRGVIERVDPGAPGLVVVSVGSEHGVKKGMTLEVYRKRPEPKYVGRLVVTEVQPRSATARVTTITQPGGGFQVNDRVTNRISRE